eukprot:CAMPEP_0169156212 /NCGR_PEP_ID=MMETSP1015-20121227/53853_1 /TAXON_ID=342587 /ORGANISM="Karlodinium micrum, Strain CCMP2283" /LENGTH=88 /DNA_ID=CAMNT_0009226911 /DNA_START=16 /DNA_END=279 /DNA_ORIENTATION=+
MISRNFNDGDFMKGVSVRNTFLDVEEEDPWMVSASKNLRRQQTDSVLHCHSSSKFPKSEDSGLNSSHDLTPEVIQDELPRISYTVPME